MLELLGRVPWKEDPRSPLQMRATAGRQRHFMESPRDIITAGLLHCGYWDTLLPGLHDAMPWQFGRWCTGRKISVEHWVQ